MVEHFNSLRDSLTVEDTFEGYFNNIEFWLHLLGMNIFDQKWFKGIPLHKKGMCSIFVCLIFMCSSFALICGFHTYKDTLDEQLSSFLAACFAFEIGVKVAILFYKRESYRQIKVLVNQYIREGINGDDMAYRPILLKYQEFTMYFFHWLVKIYLLAVCIMITFPFFLEGDWMYPINFVIPGVGLDSNPGYLINYTFISISCLLATIFFIGFDCYIILLSLFLASRFELCGSHFSKVGDKSYSTSTTEKEYLLKGMKLHSKTLELYYLCQHTLEPTVIIELISVIAIVAIEMMIILVNPYSQTNLTFCSTFTQVFFYCGCAEFVAMKASQVATELYGSHWYNIEDDNLKKLLIVILNRSQQPCYFSMGKHAPLSMETFSKICTISFRSFNCIRSMF